MALTRDYVESAQFRYWVLFLNCMLTFGSYYCFDMPANLENQIKGQVISDFTTDTDTYYNYFYLVYSWTNMLMSLCAGVMVDKLGKEKSMYLFIGFCLFGSAIYALGAALTSVSGASRFGIMFFGRFIFGLGGGPITIVQNAFTATHFKGHELAMAFGCTLTISRIGSVVNFDATPSLYKLLAKVNQPLALSYTLFIGSGLVLTGLVAAFALARLDNFAMKIEAGPYKPTLAADGSVKTKKKMSAADVKEFPALFWVLSLTISLFYSIVFPFMADSSSLLQQPKFGLDGTAASFRASLVYMMSMIVSPFLGAFVDWFGRRTSIALFGTSLTVPVFLLLAETSVDPVYSMIMLGIAYSVCAAALWPSVQLLVPIRTVGTANGVATSIQMLGIGICNVLVGVLRDKTSYKVVMFFFGGLGVVTVCTVLTMFLLDRDLKMYKGKRDAPNDGVEDSSADLQVGNKEGEEPLLA